MRAKNIRKMSYTGSSGVPFARIKQVKVRAEDRPRDARARHEMKSE